MQIQEEGKWLAHWTYTRVEWKAFIHRVTKRKGFIDYCRYLLLAIASRKTPDVRITATEVWIGNKQSYNSTLHRFRNADLKTEGQVNVLSIIFEKRKSRDLGEIKIPVPKGKLREAIEIQERLIAHQ